MICHQWMLVMSVETHWLLCSDNNKWNSLYCSLPAVLCDVLPNGWNMDIIYWQRTMFRTVEAILIFLYLHLWAETGVLFSSLISTDVSTCIYFFLDYFGNNPTPDHGEALHHSWVQYGEYPSHILDLWSLFTWMSGCRETDTGWDLSCCRHLPLCKQMTHLWSTLSEGVSVCVFIHYSFINIWIFIHVTKTYEDLDRQYENPLLGATMVEKPAHLVAIPADKTRALCTVGCLSSVCVGEESYTAHYFGLSVVKNNTMQTSVSFQRIIHTYWPNWFPVLSIGTIPN